MNLFIIIFIQSLTPKQDWRRSKDGDAERPILSLFADDPRAPYSLHNFVRHGAVACGKHPGEWFGPSATARCIQYVTAPEMGDLSGMLTVTRALANANESSLRVYSTGDFPDVYEDSFMAVANPDGNAFQPTLILVGTRLGIDKINQVYEQALISTLQMPQSIGIAGYVVQLAPRSPSAVFLTYISIVAAPLPLTTS